MQKILNLITNNSWLTDAYATDTCVTERSSNLLDAMLNTPDKIENNTPLHYACKFSCASIVETLLKFRICSREPINKFLLPIISLNSIKNFFSHNEKPFDLIGVSAKGNKQGLKEANNKIICAFRKEPLI